MFRRHRTTIAYAALAGLIALIAAAAWVLATGRLQLPPGIVVAFALGSGFAADLAEKAARRLKARRRPGGRRPHHTHHTHHENPHRRGSMNNLNDVTPLPQLKGAQLLEQLVVDELRRRQRSRGNKILLWPFPPCTVCGQHVDAQAFTLGVDDFDDRVLRNDPCGHRVKCSMKAVAQLVDQAQVLADEREAGPVAGGKPAQAATEATQPVRPPNLTADGIAAELHRRAQRLDELKADPCASQSLLDELRGEVIGLRGALGIVLGGRVAGGDADIRGIDYYDAWRARQAKEGRV